MSKGKRSTARPSPPALRVTSPSRGSVVGTAANPSPQIPGVTAGAKTPNSGGFAQRGDDIRYDNPDPGYAGPKATGIFGPGPDTPQAWRGTARPAPAPLTPTNRPQQTERADPLNGAGGPPQMPGTSRTVSEAPDVDPGKAFGASARGNATPAGEDRHPMEGDESPPETEPEEEEDLDKDANDDESMGGHIGGSGAMAGKFSKPTPADLYARDTANTSNGVTPAKIFSGRPSGTSSASMLKRGGPKRDEGADEEAD